MGDCVTRTRARQILSYTGSEITASNEFATKDQIIRMGGSTAPLDKYISSSELVNIEDVVVSTNFTVLFPTNTTNWDSDPGESNTLRISFNPMYTNLSNPQDSLNKLCVKQLLPYGSGWKVGETIIAFDLTTGSYITNGEDAPTSALRTHIIRAECDYVLGIQPDPEASYTIILEVDREGYNAIADMITITAATKNIPYLEDTYDSFSNSDYHSNLSGQTNKFAATFINTQRF